MSARLPDRAAEPRTPPLRVPPPAEAGEGGAVLDRLARSARDLVRRVADGGARAGEAAAMRVLTSNLTPSGAAIEAAFVWGGGEGCDPRVSLDPAPGGTPSARLAAALELLRRAAPTRLSPRQLQLVAEVADWQAAGGGRYGAWAGLRPAAGETAAPEDGGLAAKLYLELPRSAGERALELERRLAGAPPVLAGRDIRPTMLGLDPQGGGVEVYYRCDRLFPGDLDTLMRRFGLPQRAAEIAGLVERLTQRSLRFEIPSWDTGFSVAYLARPETAEFVPAAFTFYSNAASLLGPDERVRCALLREGRRSGFDTQAYEALFARPLEGDGAAPPLQRHGLVGAVLPGEAPMRVTATLAMPWPACADMRAALRGEPTDGDHA